MLFNFDDTGGAMSADALDFDGEAGSIDFAGDTSAWEASVNASGRLRFLADPGLVDLAIIAGGKPGSTGAAGLGGLGGKGGGILLVTGVRLRPFVWYNITVGGSGEDSTLWAANELSYAAVSGEGGTAGTPSSTRGQDPVAGGPGTEIWAGEHLLEALNGVKFGPGGGAGGSCSRDYAFYNPSAGGATGGPTGGAAASGGGTDPSAGPAGYGCGGAGAWHNDAPNASAVHGTPSLGSSGRILIRKHVEVIS